MKQRVGREQEYEDRAGQKVYMRKRGRRKGTEIKADKKNRVEGRVQRRVKGIEGRPEIDVQM